MPQASLSMWRTGPPKVFRDQALIDRFGRTFGALA
jgi:hypothetical protein